MEKERKEQRVPPHQHLEKVECQQAVSSASTLEKTKDVGLAEHVISHIGTSLLQTVAVLDAAQISTRLMCA